MHNFSDIRIAIHDDGGWGRKWINYCRDRNIQYKKVDGYASDILDRIRDCQGFMWAFKHLYPTDLLMARHVLYAAGLMGLATFPDFHASWHFDDKVAQKYLFEALDLPVAGARVFYNKKEAMDWFENQSHKLPVVAKLRRGAGSYNVKLLKTKKEAMAYTIMMFDHGMSPAPSGFADARNKFRVAYSSGGVRQVVQRLKKAPRFITLMQKGRKFHAIEKGYVYIQEFIPGNTCDYRMKVVGDRAWGFRRFVRKNDFRASGSGELDFDYRKIPSSMVTMAFDVKRKLEMQSVALDIVLDNDRPVIVEISYGFGIDDGEAEGYWTEDGVRHNKPFDPTHLIIQSLLVSMKG